MKVLHSQILLFGVLGLFLVSLVSGQYESDSDNEIDDDVDLGNRDARQAAYAYVPPSGQCARVSYGNSYCGGFSSGNKGGCDSYCVGKRYPYSFCRSTYCLCHRGKDLGRECDNLNN